MNAYDEEVQKVVGIFAPHLGAGHIHETRTTEWRIVRKAVDLDVDPLTLKSASGAPRSPVNNCGVVGNGGVENTLGMEPVETVVAMDYYTGASIDSDDMAVEQSAMTLT